MLILALAAGQCFAAELDRTPLEAVTVDGQNVRLFPNGRWEFADAAKAAEAAVITYGNLIQATINFVIIAFFVFIILRAAEKMRKKEAAAPAEHARDGWTA